ncbi:MAG: putative ABC transporter permease [Lachnospiraceae bacterium]|nr:putative ABC transporter permease [Lachnospiraceae bacterium]
MWDLNIFGTKIYTLIGYFIFFSLVGWCWESLYVSVSEKRLVNRGYVTGPFCTIYGCGAIIQYICLKPFANNVFLLAIVGALLATLLEFVTAGIMQALFHTSWWDYSDKKFNYKGIICLEASLLWGLVSILIYKLMIPSADFVTNIYPKSLGKKIYIVIIIIYFFDFVFATIAAVDIAKMVNKLQNTMDYISAGLRNTRAYNTGEEILQRVNSLRRNIIRSNYIFKYSKRVEAIQNVWSEWLDQLSDSDIESKKKFRKIADIFISRSRKSHFSLIKIRMLRAYPRLKSKKKLMDDLKQAEEEKNS